ncbi:hypothetical protein ACPVPU_11760 [Sphingomonas sp. CJ99]
MNIPVGGLGADALPVRSVRGTGANDRLDGWKQIAAHFGRDRSTVIRWAQERGLPVHRLPGGRTGTVYALRHELDRWAGLATDAKRADDAAPTVQPPEPALSPPTSASVPRRTILAAAVALLALTGAPRSATPPLPEDAGLANLFLAARDLIAERDAAGLERAISMLDRILGALPQFAPAYAARAEALILSREFGARRDDEAFRRARLDANAAVRIDPALAAGHRLLGFIAYWDDSDFIEAERRFLRAIRLDATQAVSHFWYGNILSDHGDHARAIGELNRARLMQPGSVAIRTDLAWAEWAMGAERRAELALNDIVRLHPNFAVAHDCLAIMALIRGDAPGYVRHFQAFALARGEPGLTLRSAQLASASSAGPAAVVETALGHAVSDLADGARSHVWAVTIASVARDHDRTVRLLAAASERQERWNEAGLVARIRAIWNSDKEVLDRIGRLRERAGFAR